MGNECLKLPRKLDDGLVMRWATSADTEALADFNLRMHGQSDASQPEKWLKQWTRDLMSGRHPTTGPADVVIVEDESDAGQIVSTTTLINQTWRYGEISFGCGRPELVGTAEEYRRRGLVREQFKVIHALSAAKGQLVQAITGIPWYYRQFGYEMALALGGSRRIELSRIKSLSKDKQERFQLRRATVDDLAAVAELYQRHCQDSLVSCQRGEAVWRYELSAPDERHVNQPDRHLVETKDGEVVGYVAYSFQPKPGWISELAVKSDYAMREVALFVLRTLKARILADHDLAKEDISGLTVRLGTDHPTYRALKPELENQRPPYAYFMRVPDLNGFLLHLKPVLEERLADSVMAGYSGELKLNFYKSQTKMSFDAGRLVQVEPYSPSGFFDGHGYFPDLIFLKLLFGYRSFDELKSDRGDCFAETEEAAVLLESLFPKRTSYVIPLA
ncbi:MAG: GNAT family N-acetyltransferase [Candidatus Promineifilaceae bacterium]|nr:GNAT family N-acetyltransferase [Candidatus Promineifilaceae bacterium]